MPNKYCPNCGFYNGIEEEPKVSKAPKRVDSLPKPKAKLKAKPVPEEVPDSEPEQSETVKVVYKKKPISEKQKAHLANAREISKQKKQAKKVQSEIEEEEIEEESFFKF
jgi:hypothetical protein